MRWILALLALLLLTVPAFGQTGAAIRPDQDENVTEDLTAADDDFFPMQSIGVTIPESMSFLTFKNYVLTAVYTQTQLNTSDGDAPNVGSNRVSWDNLTDVPAGFADGTDDGGGGGGSSNSFETMDAPAGTDPVASSATDTLTWLATSPVTITGDSGADSLTVACPTCSTGSHTTDTTRSDEEIEDAAGAMFSGNTESGIAATYQDSDGTVDLVVDDLAVAGDVSGTLSAVAVTDDSHAHTTTTISGLVEADITDLAHTTDTTLSGEEVEDLAGAMVTGNTETGVSVTYQDADGTVDFVVDDLAVAGDVSGTLSAVAVTDDSHAHTTTTISGLVEADITDLNHTADTTLTQEEVEDFAGALVEDGTGTHTGISVTYQDATGDVDLVVDHDAASNFVANEHVDHSAVTLTAGDGLAGTGDLTANRTFDVDLVDDADGTSATTASESGLEFLAGELSMIRGCDDAEVAKWNNTLEQWECASDNAGGGGANSFETVDAPLGTDPVAESATDTLTLTSSSLDITGTAASDTVDFEVAQDAVGLGEIDDDANSPSAGDFVVVETGATSIDYLTPDAGTDVSADLEEEAHASEHENGGADELSVAGLSGELADEQPVSVSLNSGATVGTRSTLNLIEGAGIDLTVADDSGDDEVDVTVASTVVDTDTNLTQEEVEDFAGGMVAGNTETGITVTYEDGDGTVDFAVDDLAVAGDVSGTLSAVAVTDDSHAHTTTTISGLLEADITDLSHTTDTNLTQEEVEDFAGGLVANGTGTHTGITVTYQDGTDDVDLVVDHDAASNFVADEHVAHSSVTMTAGDGVSGGGDISANRTFDLDLVDDADGTSATTASESGLEFLSGELSMIRGCEDGEVSKWNDTLEQWECAADNSGGGGANSFETVNAPAGTDPVAESATDTLNLTSSTLDITGTAGTDTVDFEIAAAAVGATELDEADIAVLGDVTGNLAATVVGDDSHAHTTTTISGLVEADITDLAHTTDTTLSGEEVEDLAGAMVTGNTETGVTVTYEDADGTLDFVVDDLAVAGDVSGTLSAVAVTDDSHSHTTTTISGLVEADITDLTHTTDTNLSDEEVQDLAGAMVTGNTETGVSVTYQDTDGTVDFVVDDLAVAGDVTGTLSAVAVTDDSHSHTTTTISGLVEADITDLSHTTDTNLTQEEVEDYAGSLVANGTGTHTGISVTYQDASGDVDLVVDHDAATNFVANEHVDHTGVTLTAGDGLAGGGDISANRTFDLDIVDDGDAQSATTSSESGLELVSGELGLVRGCDDGEVLAWDDTEGDWGCSPAGSGESTTVADTASIDMSLDGSEVSGVVLPAGVTLAGDVTGTAAASVVGDDSHAHTGSTISGLDVSDDLNLGVTDTNDIDFGQGSGDVITGSFLRTSLLSGNPALTAEHVVFTIDGTGGGLMWEGLSADTAEGLLQWNPTTTDRTLTLPDASDTLVGRATTDTLTNKTISGSSNTLTNVDISSSTNLAVTSPITLTGDTVGCATCSTGAHTTDTNLTQEEVEDFAGAMVTGNTETGIAVTYQDGDGTFDFVVDDLAVGGDATGTVSAIAVTDDSHSHTTTTISGLVEADISDLSHTTDTNLTEEEVEDFVGGMLGGTETGISVTYQDGTNDIDFVVGDLAVSGDVSGTLSAVAVTDDSHAHTTTTVSGLDISADTNLAATTPIVLTNDTLTHANSGVGAGTYTSVTVDAKGHVTGGTSPADDDVPEAGDFGNLDEQVCSVKLDPATDEEYYTVWRAPVAVTISEIYCEVTGGTNVALDLEVDDASPTGVNGSNITCTTAGVTDSSLAGDTTLAAGNRLDIDLGTVTGAVTQVSVCWVYSRD